MARSGKPVAGDPGGASAAARERDRLTIEALRRERKALETIIDTIPDFIFVKDAGSRFQIANKAWLQARGRTPAEVMGKTTFDMYPRAIAERMDAQDQAVMRSGVPQIDREQMVATERHGAQERVWVSTTKVPLRDENGNIAGVVGISRDVTQRRRMEAERAMEHAIGRVLAEASGIETAMERLISTICEAMGWVYGAHWLLQDDGMLHRAHYWAGAPVDLAPEDADLWLESERSRHGQLLGKAWREAKPTWVSDIANAANFRRKASCAKLGFHSAYAFPILAASSVIGIMEFFGNEVREPDEAVLDVTVAIGMQIGEFIRRKKAEESLQESEEQLRAMFDNASIGIAMTGVDFRYLRVNGKFAEIVGYTQEELLRMNVAEVNLEENIDEMVKRRSALLDGGGTVMREKQLLRKNGTLIWVAMVTSVIRSKDGAPRYFLSVIQDISETRRAAAALKESEEQFRQLAGNIPQVFWIADALQKQTIYISPACKDLTGIGPEQLQRSGKALMQCVHPEDRRRVYQARRRAPAGTYNETYRVVHTDGSVRWVQDRAFPVESREGSLYRIAGIVEDVTERKLAEERLVQLAHFDVLTGLPNRALFYDRLGHAVAQARRNNRVMGVMFIDVDRFKYVNDTMGHDAGDDLLKIIARRLMGAVRSDDTVGRLGGDEFAIVLNTLTAADDAALVARKIIETLNQPFLINGSEISVSGSIGVTLFPTDSTEPDDLIKNADTAMYRAKEMGRNTFQFYRPEMNAHVLQILSLETQLRRAHEKNEFVLHYQPKVDVASGEIVGAEALIRWQHPERGLVPAADFIPVLEESGLVVQVGEWVLREVCRQLKQWEHESLRLVPIALNLSARQFLAPDLGAYIERTLKEHSIEPGLIEFEITESSIMKNAEEAIRTLEYLVALGVGIAIDDFGTGYSSLAYLKRFPIKALKIDRSFVRDITTDADDATITLAIISMAHSLGLKVVAEGVETDAQLRFLARNGCDEVQGYLFSRPVPAPQFAADISRTLPVTLHARLSVYSRGSRSRT